MNIYTVLSSRSHSPHYLNRYIKFINALKGQTRINGQTHLHHICPKSLDCFPQYKNLKQNPWNGVYLTYRQHALAHWMLYKMYGGSMSSALFLMKVKDKEGHYKIFPKAYEQSRIEHSLRIKTMNANRRGTTMSQKGRNNISKGTKGKKKLIKDLSRYKENCSKKNILRYSKIENRELQSIACTQWTYYVIRPESTIVEEVDKNWLSLNKLGFNFFEYHYNTKYILYRNYKSRAQLHNAIILRESSKESTMVDISKYK